MTNEKQETKAEDGKDVTTKPRAGAFSDVRDEMDRLWEALMTPGFRPFRRMREFPAFSRTRLMPAIDVYEKDSQVHVRAELPGVKQEDVEISVSGDSLTISGAKSEASEVKEEDYYRSERSYGKFSRSISLPAGADSENATARFTDGVLEIDIPVKAVPDGKKISISNG